MDGKNVTFLLVADFMLDDPPTTHTFSEKHYWQRTNTNLADLGTGSQEQKSEE